MFIFGYACVCHVQLSIKHRIIVLMPDRCVHTTLVLNQFADWNDSGQPVIAGVDSRDWLYLVGHSVGSILRVCVVALDRQVPDAICVDVFDDLAGSGLFKVDAVTRLPSLARVPVQLYAMLEHCSVTDNFVPVVHLIQVSSRRGDGLIDKRK